MSPSLNGTTSASEGNAADGGNAAGSGGGAGGGGECPPDPIHRTRDTIKARMSTSEPPTSSPALFHSFTHRPDRIRSNTEIGNREWSGSLRHHDLEIQV